MEKLKMHTPDLTQNNIARIRELFPSCVTESKDAQGNVKYAVDFDQLRQELSGQIVEGQQERYQLNWPGKREALLMANVPIAKTLRPIREESVNFDTTKNLFVEGDNLEALKLLQETYLGKVKMIYIDPPYNTGNDFIYEDDFEEESSHFLLRSNQKDELGNRLVANAESNGRFHSDWLTMIYSRLRLARNLLSNEGVIFISIDDNEMHNLRKVCDEIFGEKNFIGLFVVNSSPSGIDYGHLGKTADYALFYAKDIETATTNHLEEKEKIFKYSDDSGGFNLYPLYNGNAAFNDKTRPNLFYPFYLNPHRQTDGQFYEISLDPKEDWIEIFPVIGQKDGIQRVWRWGMAKAKENLNGEIVGYRNEDGEYRIVQKSRLTSKVIRSLQLDNEVSSRRGTLEIEALFGKKVFSYPKPSQLIQRFATVATDSDSIILDFFAGSSSTAHAIMQLNANDNGNRQFIMVQLPELIEKTSEQYKLGYRSISDISKERIRRAGKKIQENNPLFKGDIGFRVLKIDTSNMADVYYIPDNLEQKKLLDAVNNVKPERNNPEDLLFQVLLDWGVDLTLPIRKEKLQGKNVFFVDDDALVACFDMGISEDLVKELAELKPLRVVFRDNGFESDSVKINVDQIFKQLSPSTEVKSI